ncbi:MAG: alpha/beta hydrolase-fold protein [Bacteroidota bacterium]
MKEEHFRWYSQTLSKDIDMLVYGHAGYPVIIFPTTMGRYYESKDFKLIESARWFLEQGLIQIYCPDSIDAHSWYNKSIHPADRVRNHNWYDQFILNEVVHNIRVEKSTPKVCVAGASFGGYHAANFAFRHPDSVSHLFTMSGAFDVKSFMDGYYDDNVYFNNPVDYLPDSNQPDLWQMNIVLGAGEWDICLEANKTLSGILNNKGINHWFDIRKWAEHDWPIWRDMFPHYLSLI